MESQRSEGSGRKAVEGPNDYPVPGLLTRVELAQALRVSVPTIDRMLACDEITPVRLRGTMVRFHLPDVIAELQRGNRKYGRKAKLQTSTPKPKIGLPIQGNFKTQPSGSKADSQGARRAAK